MLQDVRLALRGFARHPGFFGVAILTLALGVALTSTIFSVADNILYRPLPYPHAERLFEIFGAARQDNQSRMPAAVGDYLAWRAAGPFSSVGTYRWSGLAEIGAGPAPHRVNSAAIDDHFLATLGVQPMLGRAFNEDDCRPGASPVAIIAASLWRIDFAADSTAIGRYVEVDGVPTEIVGVLSASFVFPASTASTQGITPVELLRPSVLAAGQREDHNARSYYVIGRLATGTTVPDAQARLDAVQQAIRPLYRANGTIPGAFDGVTIVPLLSAVTPPYIHDSVTLLLFTALGVLLVASVNIANMLLARGSDRERELAIRAAVGASRPRLARLLIVEALTLSFAGDLAGLLLARLCFGTVVTELPPAFAALRVPRLDLRVVLFACAISVVVGALFGMLPAFRLSHVDVTPTMKMGGATPTARFRWVRDSLIASETALAVMLIGVGALVLTTFARVTHVNVGLDSARVLTMQVTPPPGWLELLSRIVPGSFKPCSAPRSRFQAPKRHSPTTC